VASFEGRKSILKETAKPDIWVVRTEKYHI
jgi:hypothetical protein